jgi:osmoprotectant transport system ATP-binding protein
MTTDTPILEFDEVTKIYGDGTVAIEDISFEVERGTTTVLVGPSGCGKTTTLELVNRLIEVTDGAIRFQGEDIREIDAVEYRRKLGYVIQEIGLFDHMTVGENVGIVPKLKGWDKDRIDERVDELLNLMDLPAETYRDQNPNELSGGQQQRVGVARALAADPNLLLMDEPFGALDPITRDNLQDEFLEIQSEIDKTILFVTHDIDEALKMGDKIAIYNKGSIVQYDTPKEILTNPKNEFVEEFIGSDRIMKKLKVTSAEEVMTTDSKWVGVSVSELADTDHEFVTNGEGVPQTVDHSESTHLALTKLYNERADVLPVVENDHIVGVVTERNLKEPFYDD